MKMYLVYALRARTAASTFNAVLGPPTKTPTLLHKNQLEIQDFDKRIIGVHPTYPERHRTHHYHKVTLYPSMVACAANSGNHLLL
jgi:hypothetical protein